MRLVLTNLLRTLLLSIVISIPLGNILIYPVSYFEYAIGDPLGWAKYEGLAGIFPLFLLWLFTFLPVSLWQGVRARRRLLETNREATSEANYLFLFVYIASFLIVIPLFNLFWLAFEFFSIIIFAPIDFLLERFRP